MKTKIRKVRKDLEKEERKNEKKKLLARKFVAVQLKIRLNEAEKEEDAVYLAQLIR